MHRHRHKRAQPPVAGKKAVAAAVRVVEAAVRVVQVAVQWQPAVVDATQLMTATAVWPPANAGCAEPQAWHQLVQLSRTKRRRSMA